MSDERFALEVVAELRGRVDVHEERLNYQKGKLEQHSSEISSLGQTAALHAKQIDELDRRAERTEAAFSELKDVLARVSDSMDRHGDLLSKALDRQSETNMQLVTAVADLGARHDRDMRGASETDAKIQQEITKDRSLGWKLVAVTIIAIALFALEKLL